MKNRCLNPKHEAYSRYAGAGIQIDPSWLGANGFRQFLKNMGERPSGKTLDRKDSKGNYNKDNCRWATWREQEGNRSTSVILIYKGESAHMSEWARRFSLNPTTLARRIHVQKLPIEEALTRPLLRILK